jgi:Flp pilus assembly protein TadG
MTLRTTHREQTKPHTVRALMVAFLRRESGGALIELALGITIFSTILLGAAEFGRLAYASIEVSNAAHAAAAYGAQTHSTASDSSGMLTIATADAANVSGMTATARQYCVCANGSSSTCAPTDCSSSRILEYVQVNTTAKFDPKIYVPGLPKSYTLKAQAIMRVMQ